MHEPREPNIAVLFLVLVVLSVVAYILLGKWSEATKKKERISLLAQLAAEEDFRAEQIAVAGFIAPVSPSKSEIQVCARCFAPARTRCSRCKSARYCSGNCQIIHWRQIHKQECQQLEAHKPHSSHVAVSFEESLDERGLLKDTVNSQFFEINIKQTVTEEAALDNLNYLPIETAASAIDDCALSGKSQVSNVERRTSCKSNREILRRRSETTYDTSVASSGHKAANSNSSNKKNSEEAVIRHKSKKKNYAVSEEETSRKPNISSSSVCSGKATTGCTVPEGYKYQIQHGNTFLTRSDCGYPGSSYSAKDGYGAIAHEFEADFCKKGGNILEKKNTSIGEAELNYSFDMTSSNGNVKVKSVLYPPGTKLPKSVLRASAELSCSEIENREIVDQSKVVRSGKDPPLKRNGVASTGTTKMIGLKQSVKHRAKSLEINGERRKKIKMLFPYEEFVDLFQTEVFGVCPRGLLNCGNSCYANAVLQCLTCTKPLVIYLLCRSHSKACYGKYWCLICELEQHIMMLRENGGPLSPSRILSHMQRINFQMGDGSQEDAHEFLRLLIASMQSICLEGLGGENKVDPKLQETTFMQHTFGGCIKSKVMCMRCNHDSERYENIMDLTLEIFGWVESLEDALTQFTTPEELDGENMYRCGRCTTYVQARKQLSIHEAPNILTIVLKRFQEGRYGKINKCITFPEMLDMIPYMTGTHDIPPLYILYAVVVHLDTLNASFSGHYVSYVKDLQGNWFRIDDTKVQPVPMNQVMSEGAYILFYKRSWPRPQIAITGKSTQQQVPDSSKQCAEKVQKPSRPGHRRQGSKYVGPAPLPDLPPGNGTHFIDTHTGTLRRSSNRNTLPVMEIYTEPASREFSDATSSDWSLFTSSDEASFTTDSTRDSFSTVDYADTINMDSVSSTFNYAPDHSRNSVFCGKSSHWGPLTRFSHEKVHILDSYLSTQPLERVGKIKQSKVVSDSSMESLNSNRNMHVSCGSNPVCDLDQTSRQCRF
ncbi:Ubiquitin carboxyl-terminal hydrolase [Quillaja saponaria]|uniref:ubiquitinyl hydrolase 1 n=1 Tax=Quillaja saponaria TaxID=32244 RepID=A0AAD7VN40_QUISA|nr:Ubiquitin carboxyl-terminal hydrolase [Quillaja saponaria]KAJ7981953.1 Ubiquitin carboxyl-terminal hydrolase [Quillaja saponaria]